VSAADDPCEVQVIRFELCLRVSIVSRRH
jgi:hypothetical protein